MSEKCSIIIVHTDEPDYLNLLLQSIKICSKNNDYETIIVDNASIEEKSKDFLQEIATFQEYKIKFEIERKSYVSCLISGLELISEDSNYIIFSHSDNVVLSKEWLDFMIKNDIDNPKIGALCVGPLFNY